jgi:hypothetical protein
VKRSSAIRHLVEMAEVATDRLDLRNTDFGWPLAEMWVTGDLLGLTDSLDAGSVVLVLDVPTQELPWLAIHPTGEWVGAQLRLGKRPIGWCYRPLGWPVWNHEHRRLARFWTDRDGVDPEVIEALQTRRLDRLTVVEPSDAQLADQVDEELEVSRRHLRSTVHHYWDDRWRREHRGDVSSPEDHLWRAAMAVADLLDARDAVQP